MDLKAEFPNFDVMGEKTRYEYIILSFLNECQGSIKLSVSTLEEQELGNREKYVQLLVLVTHSGPDDFEFSDLTNPEGNIEKLPITVCKYLIEHMGGSVEY